MGWVTRSLMVPLSFCKACFNSETVSFVFSLVSPMLSSKRLRVYPCYLTNSFRFEKISWMLVMLDVTLLIYYVRWFILFWNYTICCDSMSSFSSSIISSCWLCCRSSLSRAKSLSLSPRSSVSLAQESSLSSSSSSFFFPPPSSSEELSSSRFYSSYWSWSSEPYFLESASFLGGPILSFLKTLSCSLCMLRNCFSCSTKLLPKLSTISTFFYRWFSNFNFSVSLLMLKELKRIRFKKPVNEWQEWKLTNFFKHNSKVEEKVNKTAKSLHLLFEVHLDLLDQADLLVDHIVDTLSHRPVPFLSSLCLLMPLMALLWT